MPLLDDTIASGQAGHIPDHQTIAGKLNGLQFNVMDYGSSMNAARVQAAVDDCIANNGGEVWIPALYGAFNFGGSTVSIDWNNASNASKVSLVGPGSDAVTINYTGAGPALFYGTSQAGLSAPKNVSQLRGFRVDGPGKGTAGSVGILIQEASYFHLWDVRSEDSETGFKIISGSSFSTGGNLHGTRANNCKYGYRITDASGANDGEGTDHHFYGCYANGGYTKLTGGVGSVGFWFERANTCQLFGCSVEATEVGLMLNNPAGTGQSLRNSIDYFRFENQPDPTSATGAITTGTATLATSDGGNGIFASSDVGRPVVVAGAGTGGNALITTVSAFTNANAVTLAINAGTTVSSAAVTLARWQEPVIIYGAASNDNAVLATKGTVRDYSDDQANVIIAKRDTSRGTGLTTEHRLVRNLDGVWSNGGTMTSGSAVLKSTEAVFQAGDVGRPITVVGALSGPANLVTTVLSFQTPCQVTLNANATRTTGDGAQVLCQAALPAAASSRSGQVLYQERIGADDRYVVYYQDSGGTDRRAALNVTNF